MAWTLLRPTGFMQNTLTWGPRVLDGTFYSPVPDASFSIVDARDVAEVAAVALTEEGHENKAYGLSGPEAVSYREQARRVFAAAGEVVPAKPAFSTRICSAICREVTPPLPLAVVITWTCVLMVTDVGLAGVPPFASLPDATRRATLRCSA